MKYDVVVVGGNHNGLTIAPMLHDLGLKVALIEQNNFRTHKPANSAARLLALAKGSCDALITHNIIKNFDSFGAPINKIITSDGNAELTFRPEEIQSTNFGYMVDEFELADQLYQGFRERGIQAFVNTSVTAIKHSADYETIELSNSEHINASLVIACDGKFSTLRKMLGVETFTASYHQIAVIFDIEHQLSHNGLAYEKFMPSGPFAILPQKNPQRSSVVWSIADEHYETIKSISQEDLLTLAIDRIPAEYGAINIASATGIFKLTKIIAKNYFAGRTVFLGDSLHAIHPLAGQGYNLSLRDAKFIRALVEKQLLLGLDIGSQLALEQYQKNRSFDNNLMAEAMNVINTTFSNDLLPLKLIRRLGLDLIDNSSSLKKKFMHYASGL